MPHALVRTLAPMLLASVATLSVSGVAGATTAPDDTVRFATFNLSLNRSAAGELLTDLDGGDAQAATVAEIVQRTAPDVLLMNEFDYGPESDDGNDALDAFADDYLAVSQNGADAQDYPYRYAAPSNTGVASGFDLDNDGTVGGDVGSFPSANDAFGFGFFPGQFGMAVLSKYPIDAAGVRTFQQFLWNDMPGARLPDDLDTPAPADWYSAEELDVVRLSSKSHWDVPITIDDDTVHFLVSHPTPPVFDGPEDRNGLRNADEIRFWGDYVSGDAGAYIYDDDGTEGGLADGASFVVAGDQNADPNDGDSVPGAMDPLLANPLVNTSTTPSSPGGPEQAAAQGGDNTTHLSDPAFDTADFSDSPPGNLRVDYVLPSVDLAITDAGVFWPASDDSDFGLVGTFPFPSSDHRLVFVDVAIAQTPDPEIPEAPLVVLLGLSGATIGGGWLLVDRRRRLA